MHSSSICICFFFEHISICIYICTKKKLKYTSQAENSTELLSEQLDNMSVDKRDDKGDSWLSWAWSYVPAVLSDEDEEDIIPEPLNEEIEIKVNVGFYFDEVNIFFKVSYFARVRFLL